MRSLAELGIGLSVVFGIFVVALLAELWYIFSWKKSGSYVSAADCLKNTTATQIGQAALAAGVGQHKPHRRSSASGARAEFVREASLVGSFGGYPAAGADHHEQVILALGAAAGPHNLGNSVDYDQLAAPHLLFPIKEETKEDMELAAGRAGMQQLGISTMKPNSRLRSRTPSDVLTIPFTSGSSSPAASAFDTPFTTPPSSPPPENIVLTAKLSPYAACAVRPSMVAGSWAAAAVQAPVVGAADQLLYNAAAGAAGQPLVSPAAANGSSTKVQGKTPLRLLFERSPLLGPAVVAARIAGASVTNHSTNPASTELAAASPPRFYQRLSLAALFGQSSASSSPCLPL